MSIGKHHSANAKSVVWLTPPSIIDALGGASSFDLDPCSLQNRPYDTAKHHIALPEDGLALDWFGRVWLNPPYTATEIGKWLSKLAHHGRGTALVFARTETDAFVKNVWERADALLFVYGRLNFHHADGSRSVQNAGAPTVLCAYSSDDAERLAQLLVRPFQQYDLLEQAQKRADFRTLYEGRFPMLSDEEIMRRKRLRK